MAQMVRLVDDIDKDTDAETTVAFGFGGKEYVIDLSAENAAQIEAEFSFWITYARKRGTAPRAVSARSANDTSEPDIDTDEWWRTPPNCTPDVEARYKAMRQEIREWGVSHGWPSLGERGRLPRALYRSWRKHHQPPATVRGATERPVAEPADAEPADAEPAAEPRKRRTGRSASAGQGAFEMDGDDSAGSAPTSTHKPAARRTRKTAARKTADAS